MSESLDLDYLSSKSRVPISPPWISKQNPNSEGETPLGDKKLVFDESGEVTSENEEARIEFEYGPYPFANHKKLNSYKIINKRDSTEIDILSFLPAGWQVVFDTSAANDSSVSIPHLKRIVMKNLSVASPMFGLVLLHEIGHSWQGQSDQVSDTRRKIYHEDEKLSVPEAAGIIKAERDAWAFALRNFKLMIDTSPGSSSGFSWANVWTKVHKSLELYSDKIANKIEEPLRREFQEVA